MSNDKINKPSPPNPPKGGLRVNQLGLAPSKGTGMIITSPREAVDQVIARPPDQASGYEIWYSPDSQTFRLDRFEGHRWIKSKRVHVSRVEIFELADDQPSSPSSAA